MTANKKTFWIIGGSIAALIGLLIYTRSSSAKTPDAISVLTGTALVKDQFPLVVGSFGARVLTLQKYLNAKLKQVGGYALIKEDSDFGPATLTAVKLVMGGISSVSESVYNNNVK